jgi:hypothetical protein
MMIGSILLIFSVYIPIYFILQRLDRKSRLYAFLDGLLPRMMRTLPFIIDSNVGTATAPSMFVKDKFVMQLVGKIALLLTFGTVFPPLAVVICFGIFRDIYFSQLLMGRLALRLRTENIPWIKALDNECKGVSDSLYSSIHLLTVFVVFFYAFFIFDIYGDETGFKRAIWAPIIMIALPLLAMALPWNLLRKQTIKKLQSKSTNVEEDFPIEMTDRASMSRNGTLLSENPMHSF